MDIALGGKKLSHFGGSWMMAPTISVEIEKSILYDFPPVLSKICDGKCGPMEANRWASGQGLKVRDTKKVFKISSKQCTTTPTQR